LTLPAREILNQKKFFELPESIVSHSLRIWKGKKLGKEKAREILNQEDFLKLSPDIISLSLRICQDEKLGKEKAREILNQEDFFKLSPDIISLSLRIWQGEKLGKEKAKEILNQKNFLKLPFQIISHSLRICQGEKLGTERAKEILELFISTKNINISTVYNAIEIYCKQKINDKILEDVYFKVKTLRGEKRFGRLYYNLLYLPLYHINHHYQRCANAIHNYSYDWKGGEKRSLSYILNCFKEYPLIGQEYFMIDDLLSKINSNWYKDLEFQRKNNPNDIIDKHIELSISNDYSKPNSKKIAIQILDYCDRNTMLKRSTLFNTVHEILENEDFEYWT